MRLGGALFLAYLLIFALCFSYPIARIADSLRVRYLESLEEPLVDQANILAAMVGRSMEAGQFDPNNLRRALDEAYARLVSAKIYEMEKKRVDIQLYITDRAGAILFDSRNRESPGADYSRWWDVGRTLSGSYGARTTRENPDDPGSAVLYVGAPIRVNGEIAGVLTVAKPTTSINAFLDAAKPEIFRVAVLSALVAISLSLLVSLWLSGQIKRLIRYANRVRDGERVELPDLAPTELRDMGHALDKMRESLEGKRYVERYVETLTHEIKSPVSAIRGAAEILEEEMPAAKRAQFLANIRSEANRIGDLVERMLKLSELETRRSLEAVEVIPLAALTRSVMETKEPILSQKELSVDAQIEEGLAVEGDRFLLHQAVANLLQNAIDFSPGRGRIRLRAHADGSRLLLEVEDEGPGLPEYAKGKVFEKFFSLPRPDTGKKSTGLGLNFVREVAALHQGEVRLENIPEGGFRASLLLPLAKQGRSGDSSFR